MVIILLFYLYQSQRICKARNMNYQTRTNSSLLPCEHQHSGFQKLQKVQAKMMVTGPSAPLVKDDPQAEVENKE